MAIAPINVRANMQQAHLTKDDIAKTERETRKFRLLVLLFVVAGLLVQRQHVPVLPTTALATCYLVYTVSIVLVITSPIKAQYLPYVMLLADAGFAAGALAIFGVDSAFFVLLPILVIYYAIYLGYVGSFVSATVASFVYLLLSATQDIPGGLRNYVAVQLPLLYLAAFFAGYLSTQRIREQKERLDLAQLLKAERGARELLELSRSLSSALDPGALLDNVGSLASRATGLPWYLIQTYKGETQELLPVAGNIPLGENASLPGTALPAEAGSALSLALETGEPCALANPQPSMLPAWSRPLSPGRFVVASLAMDNSALGVLYLLDERPGTITEEQRGIVKGVSVLAAMLVAESAAYGHAKARSEEAASELESTVQRMARIQQLQKKTDVTLGQLRLEPAREVATLAGSRLRLSPNEFDLLYGLASRADAAPHENLLREVWGEKFQGQATVVDVTVHRLRRKLARQAGGEQLILTVRGTGYMLNRDARVFRPT